MTSPSLPREQYGVSRLGRIGLALLLLLASLNGLCVSSVGYRVGAGDTLTVTVRDHEDFGGTVVVAEDGTVRLPVIGQLAVAGMTLDEVTARLTEGYKRRLLKPDLFVALASPRPATVYVLGAVSNPGVYPLRERMGALELVMAAGGLAQEPGDCHAALLRKATGERQPVPLAALMSGDLAINPLLEDGDLLLVEARPSIAVYVTGEVNAPGLYELPDGARLLQALARAGGIRGDLQERCISIVRGNDTITRDAQALYGAQAEGDLALQKADVIRVESTLVTVQLVGEVKAPSSYTVPSGTSLDEALNIAGGATAAARLSATIITHSDGRQDTIDVPALMARGERYVLRAGDRVEVPTSLMEIALVGEVKAPGSYRVPPQISLNEVVTLAGGATDAASLGALKIIHQDGTLETAGLGTQTVSLRDGDRIIIPTAAGRIAVLGNVRSPGYYAIDGQHPYRVFEAVIRAGGLAEGGAPGKTMVIRMVNGQPQQIPVDLDAVMKRFELKADITLAPDDIVYVPKSSRIRMSDVLGTLANISLLRGVLGGL